MAYKTLIISFMTLTRQNKGEFRHYLNGHAFHEKLNFFSPIDLHAYVGLFNKTPARLQLVYYLIKFKTAKASFIQKIFRKDVVLNGFILFYLSDNSWVGWGAVAKLFKAQHWEGD